jgi:hypothetical protein
MDPEQVQQLLSSIQEGFTGVAAKITEMTASLSGIPAILSETGAGFDNLRTKAGNAGNALEETFRKVSTFGRSLGSLTEDSKRFLDAISTGSRESVDQIGNINNAATGLISVLGGFLPTSKVFDTIGQSAQGVTGNFRDAMVVANSLGQALGFPGLGGTIEKFNAHIQASKSLENGLLALHARAGTLTSTLVEMGADISKLNKVTDEFNNFIANTAERTGTSIPQVAEYAKGLLQIPGAYKAIVDGTPEGQMSLLSAAMKVARGTTQDFKDVLDVMNMQFANLGQVGKEPLELMSRMHSVTQTLGIPFNYVSSQVKLVSENFRAFGDETNAALNIIEGLSPALKKAGLGPEAVASLVGGLTGAVGNLDIAQKSFISSQTGGAGGLKGGFQIDLLLQQGKLDEVFKKMEDTLKKQFGKIVTLSEAATDEGAAAQLTKQVAFLRQGPFGQLVKSDQEAYKLLQSLKDGAGTKTGTTPQTREDLLNDTLKTGSDIQERQYDITTKISNDVTRISMAVTQRLGQQGRETLGTSGVFKERLIPGMRTAADQTDKDLAFRTDSAKESGRVLGYAAADLAKAGRSLFQMPEVEPGKEAVPLATSPQIPTATAPNWETAPTTTLPYMEPERPKPVLNETPANNGRSELRGLLNNERQRKTDNQQKVEAAPEQGREDKLTIVIKKDGQAEEKIIAKVSGKIRKSEVDSSTVGFDVGY